jgi:ECF transporter S component (folate family)
MLIAMAIVLNSFASIRIGNAIKITLYGFPLIVIGYFFGPIYGLIGGISTGIVSDLTGYGISLSTLWWILAPICWGVIPGLFTKKFKDNPTVSKIVIVIVTAAFSAYLSNTLGFMLDLWVLNLTYVTEELSIASMFIRLGNLALSSVAYSIIMLPLIRVLGPKIKNKLYNENNLENLN